MSIESSPGRRRFIQLPLAMAAGLALPGWLRAGGQHEQHGHGGGMGHAAPPQTVYTGSRELAPLQALPTGRPLAPLSRLANHSDQPGRFVSNIVAEPAQVSLIDGHPTTFWCYNGLVPGPLVEAYEGDRVEIEFVNRLPQPSTIHWHGLAVPADQDGAPMDIIEPGGRRLYHYTLPHGSAGTHWFHPHPHLMTAEQVFRGLAGAFIVRAHDDPLQDFPEQHLLISDLKLAADGGIPPNDRMDWMNGREGQFVLVNGQHRPVVTLQGTQRWRIWNACSARYLRLSLDGLPFTLVGTDGGLLGAPLRDLTELLLAPAERIEIVVTPPEDGGRTQLVAEPYDRGAMGPLAGESPRRVLADVHFAADGPVRAVPDALRPIQPLGEPTAQHVASFADFVDMDAPHNSPPYTGDPYARPTDMLFLVNGQQYDMERVDVTGKLGEIEEWTLINASGMGMDHPFHIHGGHFQVLERTYAGQTTPEPFLAWRDTVNLRAGEIAKIRMRIEEPGLRMFHCHILEHEDLGMMGNLLVEA